jgi:NAD(P)-dependent dehydrogenase (short-subunit alcohol dehydrogenase family)
MNPTHRAALVTGAAKRIGRTIALALASEGYSVAIHCHRSSDAAERLRAEIADLGGRGCVLAADLADEAELHPLVRAASAEIGPLTLLVNSASEFTPDAVGTLDAAVWDHQLATNLRAPVFLSQAFAAELPGEVDNASIVNVIDQRVLNPRPDYVSYYLSKAALHVATQTLAQALAPRIRVNAVGPGPTLANVMQTDAEFLREAGSTPLGHGSDPADIAEAVLYLARARSVTGQMIAVDGGQHLAWVR